MRLHRFHIDPDKVNLTSDFWLHEASLLAQWNKVLRFKSGQEVVLFDGKGNDRLYKLLEVNDREAHLTLITEFEPKLPKQNLYLLWSLLKKNKNDWVLQKCTELGVNHFVPIMADRSEKTGFNTERAQKIVIEAAEQCGRSNIPSVREPMHVATAISELKDKVDLYVCEQDNDENRVSSTDCAVLIGPEGGWSDSEKQLFRESGLKHLGLHDFTLRAETAAAAAVIKLLQ